MFTIIISWSALEKSFTKLNYKDGAESISVPVTEGGVGLATEVMPYKDKMIVISEKGISAYNRMTANSCIAASTRIHPGRCISTIFLIMKTDKAILHPSTWIQANSRNSKPGPAHDYLNHRRQIRIYLWRKGGDEGEDALGFNFPEVASKPDRQVTRLSRRRFNSLGRLFYLLTFLRYDLHNTLEII